MVFLVNPGSKTIQVFIGIQTYNNRHQSNLVLHTEQVPCQTWPVGGISRILCSASNCESVNTFVLWDIDEKVVEWYEENHEIFSVM